MTSKNLMQDNEEVYGLSFVVFRSLGQAAN